MLFPFNTIVQLPVPIITLSMNLMFVIAKTVFEVVGRYILTFETKRRRKFQRQAWTINVSNTKKDKFGLETLRQLGGGIGPDKEKQE